MVEIPAPKEFVKVVVVGGGVSGLTCGIVLLEAGYDVEIVAERIGNEALSHVAAALFYPYAASHPHLDRWVDASRRRFLALVDQPEAGVTEVPAPDFEAAVIEMPIYLPYLVDRFKRAGGRLTKRSIASLDEVAVDGVVVVNATGVLARRVASDDRLRPTLGQVVRLRSFGLEEAVLDERDRGRPTYLVPRSTDCVVGSVDRPWDVDSLGYDPPSVDAADTRDILARATALDARVGTAEVLSTECGLRPWRDEVRVEIDQERLAAGQRVVHDYGHGGCGVTLSWGCAEEVVGMIAEVLELAEPAEPD